MRVLPHPRVFGLRRAVIGLAVPLVFFLTAAAFATVQTVTIFSSSNGKNLSFRVYTPPEYAANPAKRYPVVISLHGIGGTGQQRANTYAPTLDARMNSGEILPMIWIFPDGQTNSFYGDAYDGHKQVYSHIIYEALPHVDANFRTIAGRDYHAMEGFSMGGFGASMYTAKHPELFSAVVEQGGALSTWSNLFQFNNAVAMEMYNGVEANFMPYSLWGLTTANATALRTQVNYKMIVGDADSQYQSNTRFRDHLVSLQIDPQFQVLPGVEHLAGSYLSEGSALRFLSEHFADKYRTDGDYDRDGDVDANDYTVWNTAFGSATALAADGSENAIIDAADYVVWRHQLSVANGGGSAEASPGSASVPEPGSLVLFFIAIAALFAQSSRCAADVSRRR